MNPQTVWGAGSSVTTPDGTSFEWVPVIWGNYKITVIVSGAPRKDVAMVLPVFNTLMTAAETEEFFQMYSGGIMTVSELLTKVAAGTRFTGPLVEAVNSCLAADSDTVDLLTIRMARMTEFLREVSSAHHTPTSALTEPRESV